MIVADAVVCDPSTLPWTRDRPPAETRHSLLRAYGATARQVARAEPSLVFARHHPDPRVLVMGRSRRAACTATRCIIQKCVMRAPGLCRTFIRATTTRTSASFSRSST